MAPPNKRQRQLKHFQEQKRIDRAVAVVTAELVDDPEESEHDFFFEVMMNREIDLIGKRLGDLIKRKPGAGSHLRNCYHKDSRTTIYSRNLEKKKSSEIMAGSKTIDMYFSNSHSTDLAVAHNNSTVSIATPNTQTAAAIAGLESLNQESNCRRIERSLKSYSQFERLRLLAILRFLRMITNNPKSRVASLQQIAEVVFGKEGASYRARTIRDWSEYFVEHSEIPSLNQGKFQKAKSLIDDEVVRIACLSYIRSVKADQFDSLTFMKWINSNLKTECELEYDVTKAERTARNWLLKLNLHYEEYRKGSTYVDGHERPDVVSYRNNFVFEFASW